MEQTVNPRSLLKVAHAAERYQSFLEERRKDLITALPFCHITRNWRGRPLESHEVIVNLIASTTTTKGLRVRAALDTMSTRPESRSRMHDDCSASDSG
jgi:hypothetical protein